MRAPALRIPLHPNGRQLLARIHLPAATAAASHMLVHIPNSEHHKPHRVVIRQLYEDREAGRITWLLMPAHHGKSAAERRGTSADEIHRCGL